MKRVHCFLLFLFFAAEVCPQSFTASVKNNNVGVDDRLEVSFTYNGDDINRLSNFRPPDFSNFIVLSGPNYSTSMQIINGAVNASQTQTFILKPRNAGTFTIGSASIQHGGNTFNSQPITINVTKGSSTPKTEAQDDGVNLQEIAENLFVRASADKNRVYKGEQVIVTFRLYSRLNITGIYSSKVSQHEGFWTEQLDEIKGAPAVEVIDGKRYQVYTINRIAVFPSKTGELTISPNEFTIPVIIQKKRRGGGGSLFDDFFNDPFFNRNESYEYKARSNKLTIISLPLPEDNIPVSFKGAVGEFTLKSEISKTTTKTNDPVTLKMEISGTGNIALISNPDLILPASGFEKYDPKSADNIIRSERISGKKNIDYLIIPRTTGKKEIPPVEFSYFSPSRKTYVTLRTEPYILDVKQGETSGSQYYAGKEEIRLLSDDIRYIKVSGNDIRPRSGILLYQSGFWLAVIFPLFILGGIVIWRKQNDKLNADIDLLRYQKAEKIAKNRFKNARKYLNNNDQVSFYSEIAQALFGYLEDKFHIPKAEFSLERASEEMSRRNIDPEVTGKMKEYAARCEFIRFAPHNNGISEMNNMYSGLTEVIVAIERSVVKGKNGK
jgi:hypothetical protein